MRLTPWRGVRPLSGAAIPASNRHPANRKLKFAADCARRYVRGEIGRDRRLRWQEYSPREIRADFYIKPALAESVSAHNVCCQNPQPRPFSHGQRKDKNVNNVVDATRSPLVGRMTAICAERSSRIAAVEVAIGGIRAIRARVLPSDFRCNAEREMFMQRQNVMTSAPYREPLPEVSSNQTKSRFSSMSACAIIRQRRGRPFPLEFPCLIDCNARYRPSMPRMRAILPMMPASRPSSSMVGE